MPLRILGPAATAIHIKPEPCHDRTYTKATYCPLHSINRLFNQRLISSFRRVLLYYTRRKRRQNRSRVPPRRNVLTHKPALWSVKKCCPPHFTTVVKRTNQVSYPKVCSGGEVSRHVCVSFFRHHQHHY